MARNRNRNAYFTVGIPLGSDLLKQLESESQSTGTSISKLIPVKLLTSYSGMSSLRSVVAATPKVNGAEANALAFLDSDDE